MTRAQIEVDGRVVPATRHNEPTYTRSRHGYRPSLVPRTRDNGLAALFVATRKEEWPALITLTKTEFDRVAARPVHYTASVTFNVVRNEPLGLHPLDAARVPIDSSRSVELLGAATDIDGWCTADLRFVDVNFRWSAIGRPAPAVRLEDAAGHPVQVIPVSGASDLLLPSLLPVSPNGAPSPFHVYRAAVRLASWDYDPRFGPRAPGTAQTPLPCSNIRWSAVRRTVAGTITRHLDIPNLVLQSADVH